MTLPSATFSRLRKYHTEEVFKGLSIELPRERDCCLVNERDACTVAELGINFGGGESIAMKVKYMYRKK